MVIWILSFLLLVLLPSIILVISNFSFAFDNFIFSHRINTQLEKIFPKNNDLLIKNADYNYKIWEYKKAIDIYKNVDCKDKKNCLQLYHNTWNAYYKYWEKSNSLQDKISYWQQSILFYSRGLEQIENNETRKNYEFVWKKLKELYEEFWIEPPEEENMEEVIKRWEILKQKVNDIFDALWDGLTGTLVPQEKTEEEPKTSTN
jgi:tetratricopeptide (TPR) repeat protein